MGPSLSVMSVHMVDKAKQIILRTVSTNRKIYQCFVIQKNNSVHSCDQEPCSAHGHVAVRGEHGGERCGYVSHCRPPHTHHQVGVLSSAMMQDPQ